MSRCVSCILTELHERLAVPLVIPASVLVPHTGVVRLGVLVLDPSGGSGDGDDVKNNGEEQQQGHDPPASGVGDPTAKHDRRSECVERDRERDELWGSATWSVRLNSVLCVFAQRLCQRVWCGYQLETPPECVMQPVLGPEGLGLSGLR